MALEPAALTRLARLLREIDIDLAAMTARFEETARGLDAWAAAGDLSRAELVLIAVNLHAYYTALETLFERIARLLDDDVPTGPAWHLELIEQMQVEVPGLRPAVVADSVVADLHELRKFRHFFRNAYVLELDPVRVREHAQGLLAIHPHLYAAITALRLHIAHVAATGA